MSAYTWIFPSAALGGSSSASSSPLGATGGGQLAQGALNLVIDPITRDLIDSDDGWFVESTDSRSIVIWQLESTYLAWWGDPFSGSRVRAILSGNEPGTIDDLRDEVYRALQPLVTDGIISELVVAVDVDEAKRPALVINYRDRSSGHPADLAYVPFGG